MFQRQPAIFSTGRILGICQFALGLAGASFAGNSEAAEVNKALVVPGKSPGPGAGAAKSHPATLEDVFVRLYSQEQYRNVFLTAGGQTPIFSAPTVTQLEGGQSKTSITFTVNTAGTCYLFFKIRENKETNSFPALVMVYGENNAPIGPPKLIKNATPADQFNGVEVKLAQAGKFRFEIAPFANGNNNGIGFKALTPEQMAVPGFKRVARNFPEISPRFLPVGSTVLNSSN